MKILVAINDSSQAEKILRFVMQIALHADEPPTLLVVIDHNKERRAPQFDKVLSLARELLDTQHLITRIRSGDPVKEIMQEAREGNYDLLILGEIQNNYLTHVLQGSSAARIAEDAPCAVIIVKGITRPIRRILLCDSGAGRSSVLSQFTAQLAKTLEGEEDVTILHVMSQISAGPGVPGKVLRASVDELIEQHTPEGEILGKDIRVLEQPGIQLTPKVRHGLVVDEILSEAHKGDYDLIIIGAHQGKNWQYFLLEDLTKKILIQSDRPVMVVK